MHQEDLLNHISQRGIACITALTLIWSQIAPAYATMQGINDEVSKASVRQVVPATQALRAQCNEDLAEEQGISLEGFSDEVMAHIISCGIIFCGLNPRDFMQVSRRSYRQALLGAALQGAPQAQYKYGLLLLSSNPSNGEEAKAWIKKAAIQGYVSAIEWLEDSSSSSQSLLLMEGKSETLNASPFHIPHRIPLPTELQEDQKDLTTKLIKSLEAEPSELPSFIRELRLLINQAPADIKALLQHDRFPNLTKNTLSLWPSDLLREKRHIKAPRILESYKVFNRLKDVIEILEKIYQKPALEGSELAFKLVELKQHYEDFRSKVCDLSSDRDSIKKYLSPIVLEDVSCDQSFIISKKFTSEFLSINAYGNINSNGTGINAVSSVGEIYAKKNCYLSSVRQELNTALERFKAAIKKSSSSSNISRIIQESYPSLLKGPLSYAPLTLLDPQYLTSTPFLEDKGKTFVKLGTFLQTLEELSTGLLLGEDSLGQAEKESLRQLKEAASELEINYKSYRDELDASTPYKRTLLLSDIKENTLFPGLEWAVSSFHRLLFGEGIVPSSLVVVSRVPVKGIPPKGNEKKRLIKQLEDSRINTVDRRSIHNRLAEDDGFKNLRTYVVQITPEVKGETLNKFLIKALNNAELFETLDKEQVQELILSSFLTNPNDAKGDNFIVTAPNARGKRQIIGIDNDRAFASFIVNHQDYHAIETKNLLFALPELMGNSLEESVRKRFLSHTPVQFLLKWLGALQHRNQRYEDLIERKILEEKDASLLGLPLKLKTGTVKHILAKMIKLQQLIDENPLIKLQELLKALHPLVGAYYECIAERPEGILEFFGKLYDKAFNIKTSLEAVLPKDPLVADDEVEEALKQEKTIADDYRIRTQTINEAVEEVLEAFDPTSAPSILKAVLEELHISFPHILEHMLLKMPLSRLLPASSSSIFLDIVFKNFPERLYKNEDSFNPLHYAMDTNDLKLFTYLIDKVSINLTSIEGLDQPQNDPLKEEGHSSALFSLLNHKDSTGKTYLDLAVQKESTGFFTRLVSYGAQEILDIPTVESFYLKHKPNPNLKGSFQTLFTKNPCFQGIVLRDHFLVKDVPYKGATRIYLSGYKKPFYLSEALEDQLFDKSSGRFKVINTDGRREIGLLEKGEYSLFFKKYPAFPGIEQGVRHLAYRLFQENMGYSVLAKINDEPYLLSLGIGRNLTMESCRDSRKRLEPYKANNLSHILDHKSDRLQEIEARSLSIALVMAMLVNQEDGKPNNFALEAVATGGKYRLLSFDNDQAFVPEIMKPQGKGKACPQVKSVLFCLEAMKDPLHEDVVKRLMQVDIDQLFKEWLEEMQAIHEADQALFTKDQRGTFWHKKEHLLGEKKECYIGVPLLRRQEGETEGIGYLYGTLALMQRCVRENQEISGWGLLKAVHLFVAHRYQQGLRQCGRMSVGEKFTYIDGSAYRGKVTLTTSGRMVEAWDIPSHEFIKEAAKEGKIVMPRTALKDLEALQQKRQTTELDILTRRGENNALILALLHGKAVESINLDLRGYTNYQEERILQELTKQYKVQALFLRASSITDGFWQFAERPLTEMQFFDCQNLTNGLFLLLVNQCPLLEKLSVTAAPRITAVEKGSSFFAASEPLVFKRLSSLNLSKNKQLERVQLKAPFLAHLFLSGCVKLKTLDLIEAPTLESLDIRENPHFGEDELLKLCSRYTTLRTIKAEGYKHVVYPELLNALPLSSPKLKRDLMKACSKDNDLKVLDLSGLHLQGKKVRALSALTQLTSLNLGSNDLGDEGAQTLSALTQLTSLNLVYNKIGPEGAGALSSLTQLTSLNLSINYIGAEGVRALSSLTQLTSLDLWGNHLGAKGAQELSVLTQLTSLNLGNNEIKAESVRALSALTQLTSLDLRNNHLGDEGALALSSLTQLTSLDLRDNKIKSEGAQALSSLTRLTSLNLEYNTIGPEGAQKLSVLTRLTSLNLEGDKIRAKGIRALSSLTQLTSLDLGNNEIKAESVRALTSLTQLTSLNLSYNTIGPKDAQALAALTGLTSLSLVSNNLGAKGAQKLSVLAQLTSLDLRDNEIKSEGAQALAALTGLTLLDLWYNQIGDKGAQALAVLTQLTSLDLGKNKIGDEGALALSSLTQLTSLDLRDNKIKSEGAQALSSLTQLTSLKLWDNEIKPEGAQAVAALTHPTSLITWYDKRRGVYK